MAETKIGMKIEEETKDIKKICEPLLDSIKHEFAKGIEQIDVEEMKEAIDMVKDLCEAKKSIVEACYYVIIMEAMEKAESKKNDEDGSIEDGRRGYRGQARSETSGRYMSRGDGRRGYEEMMPMDYDEEYMRDMDKNTMGRMYYAGGGSGSSGGGSGSSGGQSSGGMSGGNSGGSSGGSRGYSDGGSGRYYGGESSGNMSSRSENARRGYEETKKTEDGSPESKKKSMESLEHYMKELGGDISDLVGKMDNNEKTMIKQKLATLAQKIQ